MAFEDSLIAQEVRLTLNDKIRAIRAANTGSKFTLKDAFAGSVHNDALYDWFLAFTRASERKENFQNVCNVSVDKPNHFWQINIDQKRGENQSFIPHQYFQSYIDTVLSKKRKEKPAISTEHLLIATSNAAAAEITSEKVGDMPSSSGAMTRSKRSLDEMTPEPTDHITEDVVPTTPTESELKNDGSAAAYTYLCEGISTDKDLFASCGKKASDNFSWHLGAWRSSKCPVTMTSSEKIRCPNCDRLQKNKNRTIRELDNINIPEISKSDNFVAHKNHGLPTMPEVQILIEEAHALNNHGELENLVEYIEFKKFDFAGEHGFVFKNSSGIDTEIRFCHGVGTDSILQATSFEQMIRFQGNMGNCPCMVIAYDILAVGDTGLETLLIKEG